MNSKCDFYINYESQVCSLCCKVTWGILSCPGSLYLYHTISDVGARLGLDQVIWAC